MYIDLPLVIKNTWSICWVLFGACYGVCTGVAINVGFKNKWDNTVINKSLETFINTRFNIAMMFTLFSVLFFWRGREVMLAAPSHPILNLAAVGVLFYSACLVIELLDTLLLKRKAPITMLDDKDLKEFAGIAIFILVITGVMAVVSL